MDLRDLTFPVDGSDTLRRVLGTATRRWVTNHLALSRLQPPGAAGELHRNVLSRLQSLASSSPHLLAALVREPTHLALVGAIHRHVRPGGDRAKVLGWLFELHLDSLLHLSAIGALDSEVRVSRPSTGGWPVLRSPLANLELRPHDGVREVGFRSHRVRLVGESDVVLELDSPIPEGTTGCRAPYHPIADGILLATTDNNPLVDVRNHPERDGNPLDLAERSPTAWVDALREAHGLIAEYLPGLAAEMRQLLRLVVPVGWHEERHFSASYEEAVGSVYLTLHPNPMTLAEALIHEFQHNKLYAVLAFDPLLVDGDATYRSPLRPDPRPLRGVLFAVHAFQPVAKLYEAMTKARHPLSLGRDWERRFQEILRINREGAGTVLASARVTRLGRGLLDEMERIEVGFREREAR